ncbi:MAG: urate hydroxylase PuuD [Rhizomicrobium sp.]
MAAFLGNLRNVVIAGFVLAILLAVLYGALGGAIDNTFWSFVVRWLHVASGVMWIGLLWYFNFVSTPTAPRIPEELRPALGRYITPSALFWFRWSAMSTIVLGLGLASMNGTIVQAYTLDAVEGFVNTNYILIGIGMWLGTIMWFNVWFLIWPNQQRALNIDGKFPNLAPPEKAAAGKISGQFSRINTLLSIPMLFCMVAASHI